MTPLYVRNAINHTEKVFRVCLNGTHLSISLLLNTQGRCSVGRKPSGKACGIPEKCVWCVIVSA